MISTFNKFLTVYGKPNPLGIKSQIYAVDRT